MSKQDNPIAVGFGQASADEPPFPAQQHLDVTDDLGGSGLVDDAVSAEDYNDLDGAENGDNDQDGADDDEPDNDADDDEAPDYDATVADIEAWVAEHPEDAQRYLDAENAKSKPRSSLVDSLEAAVAE